MTREQIIDDFIEWAHKTENHKIGYKGILKKTLLEKWDTTFFNEKLFIIDFKNLNKSISTIKKLIYSNDDPKWEKVNRNYRSGAPLAILGDKNYLKFLRQYSDKNNTTKKCNYFVCWTNQTSIEKLTNNKLNKSFWFTGIYQRRSDVDIGDIVFFVQKGEKSRIDWERGLSAICEVTAIRDDRNGKITTNKKEYYEIELKTSLIFPEILSKEEFDPYPSLQEIVHITNRNGKNEPNQTIWLFPEEKEAKKLVGVLMSLFPHYASTFVKLFGKDFGILIDSISKISTNNNLKSELDYKLPSNIEINTISNESFNLIVYGAPGTGKSHELKGRVEGNKKKKKIALFPDKRLRSRITFHPNYSYRNFVGSYKPKPLYKETDKKIYKTISCDTNDFHNREPLIEYTYEPGPFLKMYVKAYHNPKHNFVIVIEEINRANTAAVFGDIFQLLDRDTSGKSEYPISLEPAAHDYLKSTGIDSEDIYIPANLYIWATMNNADQGVFPMDSAFKRRWSFEYLSLNANEKDIKDIEIVFPWEFTINWNEFREKINNELITLDINEDKLIGPFFLNREELASSNAILNKLLLYLKEDVLKYSEGIFRKDLKTFSKIAEKFKSPDSKVTNVFDDKFGFENES